MIPTLGLIILTAYAVRLWYFMPFFRSEFWSIEHSAWESPDFWYPWVNRGIYCFQLGNYQGALANFLKAVELRPDDWKVNYDLTQVYMLLGNLKGMRERFEKASHCTIDGREQNIASLMARLKSWIDEVEALAKEGKPVNFDLRRFDMQR